MPLYDVHCNSCGCKFEEILKISEDKIDAQCPTCNSSDCSIDKFPTNTGFILKGGGWAKDRYSKTSSTMDI